MSRVLRFVDRRRYWGQAAGPDSMETRGRCSTFDLDVIRNEHLTVAGSNIHLLRSLTEPNDYRLPDSRKQMEFLLQKAETVLPDESPSTSPFSRFILDKRFGKVPQRSNHPLAPQYFVGRPGSPVYMSVLGSYLGSLFESRQALITPIPACSLDRGHE